MIKRAFLVTLLFLSGCVVLYSAEAEELHKNLWVKLTVASDTADFRINIPFDGCLSIISTVPGRKQRDLLWGPRLMKKAHTAFLCQPVE
ncbi:MAG: hypothetical protein KKB51_06560 [Candidatus Riflebacteria bacterium]|nr:hypothetical protein [Candidatus Riflebacteria bacterium]